jgi:hypothetical protein
LFCFWHKGDPFRRCSDFVRNLRDFRRADETTCMPPSQWVHEWMTQGPRGKAELPFHLRRYLANYNNVPVGHFSVLTEMTLTLIAPLEVMGYTLPESLWP